MGAGSPRYEWRRFPKSLRHLALALLAGCATLHEGPASDFPRRFTVPPKIDLARYASQDSRPFQDPNLALSVAISGGGHRSCNFAAGILRGLEEIPTAHGNALLEIDYLTTVSGGSFAGAVFMSSLCDHLSRANASHADFRFGRLLDAEGEGSLRERLRTSFTSALVWGLLDPVNWFTVSDRGDDMEIDVDDTILGRQWRGRSLCLRDIFVSAADPERSPEVPYWVSTGAIYETGAIFPFTPDILECYDLVGYTHRGEILPLHDPFDLPLSVAVKASASLPAAVPASTFESEYDPEHNPYLHVTDGGLADNLSVLTALSMLVQDEGASRTPGRRKRKVLLVIDAFNGPIDPFSASEESPWMGRIAWRVLSLSMHSWRGRYREIVSPLAEAHGIEVFYLCFEDLEDAELAEKARAVATDLSVTAEEQETLFAAADQVIRQYRDRLLKALTTLPVERS